MRNTVERKDGDIEIEKRRVQNLTNVKEQNIMMQLELREYRQERDKLHQTIQDISSECDRSN